MAYKRISPIPVVEGGTGALTLTGVIIGSGTSALTGNAITQYNTLVAGASNAISSIAPSATSGVPFISQGSSSNPVFGTAVVAGGGTGATSFTAYAVICGGTTSTGILQSVASVGTTGQVLTSNGAGALPTFQATGGSGSIINVKLINNTNSPYTVLSTDYYIGVDPSSAVVSVLLPNGPTTGTVYIVKDYTGAATTHNITVTTVGGAVNIDGATTFVMNTNYQSANFVFDGTRWQVY